MSENTLLADWQEPKWYVLFVRSNQEKRVTHHLRARGVEHFLASYESVRQWKDRRVKLQMPLFPGYVFVHLSLVDRAKVLAVPNVICLVGSKHAPSFVSNYEIAGIRHCVRDGRVEPHEYPNVGERVVITDGALAGMQGILLQKRNGARIAVLLDSIARAFVVEMDAVSLELAGPSLHKRAVSQPERNPTNRAKRSTQEATHFGGHVPEVCSATLFAERRSSCH